MIVDREKNTHTDTHAHTHAHTHRQTDTLITILALPIGGGDAVYKRLVH